MAQERYPVTSNDESNTQTENLEIGKLNFPDLTSSELDSVTDAEAGDTYFDTDRNQLVRFTGPSSYVPITSYTEIVEDTNSSVPLTFGDLTWFDDGVIPDQGEILEFTNIYTGGESSNKSIIFYDGFGWYDETGDANNLNLKASENAFYSIRFPSGVNEDINFSYKYGYSPNNSSFPTSTQNIITKDLKVGTKYFVETNKILFVNSGFLTHKINFDFNTTGNDIKYLNTSYESSTHDTSTNPIVVTEKARSFEIPTRVSGSGFSIATRDMDVMNAWIYSLQTSFYITPSSNTTMTFGYEFSTTTSSLLISDAFLKITTLV